MRPDANNANLTVKCESIEHDKDFIKAVSKAVGERLLSSDEFVARIVDRLYELRKEHKKNANLESHEKIAPRNETNDARDDKDATAGLPASPSKSGDKQSGSFMSSLWSGKSKAKPNDEHQESKLLSDTQFMNHLADAIASRVTQSMHPINTA